MASINANPTSGSLSSPGIGSGVNIGELVTTLVEAERKPAQTQIDKQRVDITTQTSALGSLKSLLSAFKSSLSSLADGSAFTKRTATSSNTALFTATTTGRAVAGSYQVEVMSLATAQKLTSSAFGASDAVGTGTLSISIGGQNLDLTIDSSNNTLAGIRDAINNASNNPGVQASIVHAQDGDHLVLSSTKSGVENAFSISASGGDGGLNALSFDASSGSGAMTVTQAASDTQVKIDGLIATSSSLVVSNAIDGVSINVASAKPGEPASLTVGVDTASMKNSVKAFVDAYNNFVKGAGTLSSYDKDSGKAGPLLGDATLRGVRSQLSTVLTGAVGNDALRTLGDIGIKLKADGLLEIEDARLSSALTSQSGDVAKLFGGEKGFGTQLNSILDGYIGRGGVFDARTTSLDERTRQLDQQQERLDTRMQSVQARYLRQFNAMDTMLAQMNQTSSFLSSQLEMLSNFYRQPSK